MNGVELCTMLGLKNILMHSVSQYDPYLLLFQFVTLFFFPFKLSLQKNDIVYNNLILKFLFIFIEMIYSSANK